MSKCKLQHLQSSLSVLNESPSDQCLRYLSFFLASHNLHDKSLYIGRKDNTMFLSIRLNGSLNSGLYDAPPGCGNDIQHLGSAV